MAQNLNCTIPMPPCAAEKAEPRRGHNIIMDCSCNSFIGAGGNNVIGNTAAGYCFSSYSVIAGGCCNCIDTFNAAHTDNTYSFIGGGCCNILAPGACGSVLAGGTKNGSEGILSFIGGGRFNNIYELSASAVIAGGFNNKIGNPAAGSCAAGYSAIVGGEGNCIDTSTTQFSRYDFIGGGKSNIIGPGSCYSSVVGGNDNTNVGMYSGIGAGQRNAIGSTAAGYLLADHNFIGGGQGNSITTSAAYGTFHSFIGGGQDNVISPNVNHSSVLGGCANTNSGNCSAILGGSGNTISAAYSYAGVFGQNVAAVSSNMFHVEALNACATPLTGTAAACTLSYLIVTPLMGTVGFPVGAKIAMIG